VNCIEYFRSVNRIPLKLSDRFLCYAQIMDWLKDEGYQFIARDIALLLMEKSPFASRTLPLVVSLLRNPFREK